MVKKENKQRTADDFSTMYNQELLDIANYVYSLGMDRANYFTKSIMQYELGTF